MARAARSRGAYDLIRVQGAPEKNLKDPGGTAVGMDILADPERLAGLDVAFLDD